jgi:hypothetical protein
MDAITEIKGHSPDDNNYRVALGNQLSGIDGFIQILRRAKYIKNRVVTQQKEETPEVEPNLI